MSRRRVLTISAAIVLFYLVVQLAGLKFVGLTDDDDFYIPAGISYADWLGKVVTFKEGALQRSTIEAAFSPNHEHPPVAKYVFGICRYAFGFLGSFDGARVGTVLFSTLCAALLLWMAVTHLGDRRGLWAGGIAVALLLFLPRFYFHSHAATLDVPVAAMYLATAALVLRGERSTKAALWAGPVFGLASATKLNAPFLVVPYLVFAVLVRLSHPRKEKTAGTGLRIPPLPLALFSMAIIGPIVFFIVWPWMWFDTTKRVGEYVGFHLNHYGIYFLYFGQLFDKNPFAPWHAPIVMGATTVPLATSALAGLGILLAAPKTLWRVVAPKSVSEDERKEADLVLSSVLHAGVAVLIVCFSGGPKYGGAKLFMPFFPFWCLLAGYGAVRLVEFAAKRGARRLIPIGAVALAVASSLALQLRFGGYALSQYNALAGGLRGATATGFERQYYDIAFRDLVAYLSEAGPKGLRVHFLPNNWEYVRTYKWYRKDGELRGDIQVVNSPASADWIIVTHERRFARYGQDLQRYRSGNVIKERRIDGTPIWSVVAVKRPPTK